MYEIALCINLKRRPDRKLECIKEFERFGITNVEFIEAVDNPLNGMAGLHQTMINIFRKYAGRSILVFEDDVRFNFSVNYYNDLVSHNLPKDYYIFYLGGNATAPVYGRPSEPIRTVRGGFLTTHAILYSNAATWDLSKQLRMPTVVDRSNTYDVWLSEVVQPSKPCYVAYPAIASQKYGYSDICKFEVNYDYFNKQAKVFYN